MLPRNLLLTYEYLHQDRRELQESTQTPVAFHSGRYWPDSTACLRSTLAGSLTPLYASHAGNFKMLATAQMMHVSYLGLRRMAMKMLEYGSISAIECLYGSE